MANIYDTAHQLARELRQEESYKALDESFQKVIQDEGSRQLYDRFRNEQIAFQQKAMMGQEITEEDQKQLQDLQKEIESNELLSQLMTNERQLSTVIEDINKIVTGVVADIYRTEDEK